MLHHANRPPDPRPPTPPWPQPALFKATHFPQCWTAELATLLITPLSLARPRHSAGSSKRWLLVPLLLSSLMPRAAGALTCDFSACEEFSPGSPDDDCCATDSDAFCPAGFTKSKVLRWVDTTWINAPSGFTGGCVDDPPYNGNTCCSPDCTFMPGTCIPDGCTDTKFDFNDMKYDVWNLGYRGHSCTTYGGSCVTEGRVGKCNCDKWDKAGCEDTDGSGNADDGTACSVTSPEGGAPRALDTDPPILRIDGVGVAGTQVVTSSTSASPGTSVAGQQIDLIIRNVTYYEPFSSQWTYISGGFGQINLNGACDGQDGAPARGETCPSATWQEEVEVEFCAVLRGTSYANFVNGETLTLDQFPLTFYNLCALAPHMRIV